MKKSKLRNIIRESIKGLMNEQQNYTVMDPNYTPANLNGCPLPNPMGPFPQAFNAGNWVQGNFVSTISSWNNPTNRCNFINSKWTTWKNQIETNISTGGPNNTGGPPYCNARWNNMLKYKMGVLLELGSWIPSTPPNSPPHIC